MLTAFAACEVNFSREVSHESPFALLASNLNEFESLRRRPYIYAVHLDNFIIAMGAAVREL